MILLESVSPASPPSVSLSPAESASAASVPDQSAWFKREVLPHAGELRSWLRSRYPGAGDPDDLIQDAYILILGAQRRGAVRHPRALLFVIARNLALQQIHRHHRSPVREVSPEQACAVSGEEPDAAEAASRAQEVRLLRQAIAQLPPQQNRAFELYHFEELTGREAGQRMGLAQQTVHTHLKAAFRSCAIYFSQYDARARRA